MAFFIFSDRIKIYNYFFNRIPWSTLFVPAGAEAYRALPASATWRVALVTESLLNLVRAMTENMVTQKRKRNWMR